MPELAEVEYYRKQWDAGLGKVVMRVHLHWEKRVFRGTDTALLAETLTGARLRTSESRGKQMLFRFSGNGWLGLHLGMTGRLSVGPAEYHPEKHDHLVLFQKECSLIFNDMRQFGRIHFAEGRQPPAWWVAVPFDPRSAEFTFPLMDTFLTRHGRLAIKPALLLQDGFPGIGNWMADEILWRAGIAPKRSCARLTEAERRRLHRETRFVAREALAKIGPAFGDPPRTWLFHQRWSRKGICPRHKTQLARETIGGRTTAWCPACQS